MPEKTTMRRARQEAREGKAPSTQAGEFVREEMEHIRRGKHGARSTKQAIAIGLSKARRAGVPLRAPAEGKSSPRTRTRAQRDLARGRARRNGRSAAPSRRRSRGATRALKREGRGAASRRALSRQARSSARARGKSRRRAAANKAATTRRSKAKGQRRRRSARR